MTPDLINGIFEILGAFVMSLDVMRIVKDKQVSGVYWPGRIFFLSWGIWNLYFYPYYSHWWSFIGGLALVAVNATWIYLVIYYKRKASE